MTSTDAPLMTVVIPVYNSRSYLPELHDRLASLKEPPGGYEVVFIDDRSSDGGGVWLAEACRESDRMQMIEGVGIGPAAARNVGIARAQGRFIAFTDADTLPELDWLATAAEVLAQSGVRALEGAVLTETDDRQSDVSVRNVRNEDGGRFMTANMFYERRLLEELGGFDERFRRPFLEDSDIAFRVLDTGATIPFAVDVRVRHRDVTISPVAMLRSQDRLQWMALLAAKHPRRYREELRTKVQLFRPGDVELVTAVPLAVLSRRHPTARVLALAGVAVATRRVLLANGIMTVPVSRRAGWAAAILVSPFVRLIHVGRGWWRFGRPPL